MSCVESLRGDQDDRDEGEVGVRPDAARDLVAVDPRHHDVEEDEVRRILGDAGERLLARWRGVDGVAARTRAGREDLEVVGKVVDDQDRRVERRRLGPATDFMASSPARRAPMNRSTSATTRRGSHGLAGTRRTRPRCAFSRSVASACAVRAMMGMSAVSGSFLRMRVAVHPSMRGIEMSIRISVGPWSRGPVAMPVLAVARLDVRGSRVLRIVR